MNRHSKLILAAGVAAVGIVGWRIWPPSSETGGSTGEREAPSAEAAVNPRGFAIIESARGSKTPAEAKRSLAGMRTWLKGLPAAEAAAVVRGQLASGDDFTTGLDFTIGHDRNLSEWPSYRVFLLDILLEIDPEAGAAEGRGILAMPTSADEWAVAMRNVGKVSDSVEDRELLMAKSAELLRNEGWSANPTAGYLEAFDVIVHTRHVGLAPDLIERCDDRDARAVRHASFLTLDRLVQADPVEMLARLTESAAEHPDSGLMISNMIARADVREPAQRQAIERYLLDPRRNPRELEAFAGIYPNANQMVSQNLLTDTATFEGGWLTDHDRAALEVVSEWLADPRFEKLQPVLRETERRLRSFVSR